ncbi:MAG: AI-2E family transporter [Methylotenera sp.]|nr:AI-2E family transporter [Oligoflexia bacterium]
MTGRKVFSFLIVALFLYIAPPLFIPVAFGAIFAVLFFPAFEFLQRKKVKSSFAAALISLLVTHVFLLPSALLLFVGARTGLQQLGGLRDVPIVNPGSGGGAGHPGFFENLVNTPGLHGLFVSLSKSFPVEVEELVHTASDLAKGVSLRFADFLGDLVTRLPVMIMGMVIMVLSTLLLSRRWKTTHSVCARQLSLRLSPD